MKLKFSSVEIKSDLLPHNENETNQYKEIAGYILDTISENPYFDMEIDDKILYFSTIFTTKLIEGIVDNIYSYAYSRKGAKYLSGDASMSISEAITYATFNILYNVKFSNIIPFRSVKYLGTIADAMIDLTKEEKLRKSIGAEGGLLFINIRSSMNPRTYYILDKIAKSLMNIEIVRYPNNYGVVSLITREDENLKETFIYIKP
ncbi:hypothetical protein [Sulfurisphaera ohwakuensis]|uniref:Uncharacterized protein n=1 Tax=Sulfurisphaera ohwakuensis TaxID=69656 RepID=A0A650CEP6_SULOH|nr:hypothetical protein [Sulfurisphaera ohwakuensis]MBB5252935.1 hypothetical protein [Sulfurisphaera ohwakuensis]QGR16135.1 hypothetical protein D1869_02220 [Sulfurisphaera ohwakuensis]